MLPANSGYAPEMDVVAAALKNALLLTSVIVMCIPFRFEYNWADYRLYFTIKSLTEMQ